MTLTAPSLQPPKQKNENRKDVAFDPCTWIDDATVERAGFSPASRKRNDFLAEFTSLGCEFSGKDFSTIVASGNLTLPEYRKQYAGQYTETTVDGKNAILIAGLGGESNCHLIMSGPDGYFSVQIGRNQPSIDPCIPIRHVTEVFASVVPKSVTPR